MAKTEDSGRQRSKHKKQGKRRDDNFGRRVVVLSCVDMNTDCNKENGDEAKEDDGVDKDGSTTGLHVRKLHNSAFGRQLEQQPWRQQHKKQCGYYYRPPIRHVPIK